MKNLSLIANTKPILIQEGEEAFATNKSAIGIKYDNVYITPSYIKFNEAFEGVTYRQRITIKNVGNRSALIRIRQPSSLAFQVKTLTSGMRISPGLSITTCVTYTFKRPSVLHAIIPIEINGKIFDYRAICTLVTGHISIDPKSIDFGTIDIGYSSGLKILTIHNEGSKSTRFSIDLGQNDLDITIKPRHGRIKPQKEVKLQIELMGGNEGVFYSEFWIKSTPNIRVPIQVHIIIPRLVVYHPNTTGNITLIDFPPTIENTSRCDTFVLRNLSSRISNYVVLGELDNEVKCIRDIHRKHNPIYSAFEICPLEGRMNPFQGIIFEVKFSPITMLSQWRQKHKQKQPKKSENQNRENRDFMAFMRIIKVDCIERDLEDNMRIDVVRNSTTDTLSQRIYIQESMMEISSLSTSCVSNIDSGTGDIIRLCLYGEAETVQLHLEPDSLYFGDLIVGQLSQRVLRLTNPSIAPIYVECVPSATAHCCPSRVKLKSNTSIEILIKVRGKESNQPSFKLLFNVTADSYNLTGARRCLEKMKVGSYFVKCTVNIIKSKNEFLNERSLPTCTYTKANDDEEIMKRLLLPPKWKLLYKNYSKIIDKFTECLKRCSLKKSIFTTNAIILIPLSPLQIYNVHIFPTTFAFGMVASNSFNYQRLVVKNTNNIPVMIRLMSVSTKYIRFPEGNLMILQPNSMATRLVEYLADGLGKFNGYINYMINDNHSFELSITANVVRKQLYIDKREIELGKEWSGEEVYRPMDSVIRVTNKLGAKIYFRWEIPSAAGFYIEPRSGSIRGNATLYAYVYYESNNAKTNSAQAIMICESGSCVSLKLNVPRFVPRVEFVNDSTNLGEIPLNLPTKVIAVLQNFEFNEMAYEIDSASLIRGCDVNPLRGKISPRGIVILEVRLMLDVCCRFSIAIPVTIQGCLRLLYRINGNVSFPRLKILPQRIDIKRVSIDAFQIHQITATNIGTTTLKLQILLEEYPEFRVLLMANNKNSEIGMEGIPIAPGASQNLYLHFLPIDLASYAFYLPIMINQLLGPVSTLNSNSTRPSEFLKSRQTHYEHLSGFTITSLPDKLSLPTIFIDCTVAGRVVFFNKLMFQFNSAINKVSEEFSIENQTTPGNIVVSINIEKFNEADCPFTIEWSCGAEIKRTFDSIDCILCPGSSVFFVLKFKPKKHGSFSIEAPIYVRGKLDDGMFNKLHLDGEFPASSIDVEPTKIYFTPVPLGTAIEEKFKIQARHFDNVTFINSNFSMTPGCSDDYKDKLLRIEFSNGNIISPQPYVELEARIIFKSDQPISFCSTIKFWDNHELAMCFLTIYATADNNLLTTYIYPMKSSIFDETNATDRYLEEHISYSLNNTTDEIDEEILQTRKRSKLFEPRFSIISHFDNRSRSFVQKNNKYSLHENEEINTNKYRINNKINGNWAADDDDEEYDDVEVLICKKHSAFPIDLEASNHKQSERLPHPYYPTNDQNSDCKKYIQRVMTIVEEWIYSSPLKFHFYPNIAHGITAAFSNFCVKKKSCVRNSKQKIKAIMPSFIDVLESLTGSEIRNYLGELLKQQPLPENDIERINHVLQLYDKMLDFLIYHGAYLIHISTQYLLSYDDYLISIDMQNNTHKRKFLDTSRTEIQCEQLSRQLFESRSKQCWLDVILQTYKCFVLRGIHEHKFDTSSSFAACSSKRSTINWGSIVSTSSLPRQYELHERAIWNIVNLSSDKLTSVDNRCSEERFLLSWLQYHYEQQCVRDWMTRRVILNPREKQDVAEHRAVQNFHRDLSDSLVLIAVTAAYCPFLIDEYFSNLYICIRNKQEALHNAICLITAWRKIRLGFMITPMQLVNPNQVQMLMLVVYLFQALPTYVPHAKIKFSCPLSHTVTKRLSVSNPTNNTVNYLLSFVNNTNRFFIVLKPVSILRLNAHGSSQIQIQFHARKIRKSRAYLLLCGNAVGPHFGRNQTIILESHIDNLEISNEYTIQSKLYEIVDTSLRINIPYRNAAEYDIWMTEERPSQPSNLKMTRWCELRARKIPRRLFLNQKSIVVAEGVSEAYLSISIACIAPEQRKFWLIFQAKTGDFIIQINSVWQTSTNDHIVVEWTIQGECICSDQQSRIKDCPFNINILIPSRNTQLWKCVTEMFQKTLESKERQFWSKYLGTYIELRLIRWLMGNDIDSTALEFVHIFNTTVTYKVTISDKSSPLIVPECFTIQDVRPSYQQVPMSIHVLPTTPPLYETTITFTSLDGKEFRIYIIDCLRS